MSKENNNNIPLLITNEEETDIFNPEYNKGLIIPINKEIKYTKKYDIQELNVFRDDILQYFKENFQSFSKNLKIDLMKINKTEKKFEEMSNIINSNYNKIINTQINMNIQLDKLKDYDSFYRKTNEKLISHEIRLNNIRDDFHKATQKYDKIYLDNLELPGYIGRCAKYKNCQYFFTEVIKELASLNQFKEKNLLDLKSYKEKLENIIKSINILIDNNNNSQIKYINDLNQKNITDCQNMIDIYGERIREIKVENAKYSIDIINQSKELSKKWEKVEEIKKEIFDEFDKRNIEYKKINDNILSKFNEFKNEYRIIRSKFFELADFIKDIRFRKNIKNIYGEILKKKNIKNIFNSLNEIDSKKNKAENNNKNIDMELETLKDISSIKNLEFKPNNILEQNLDISGEVPIEGINEYMKKVKTNFKKSVEYSTPFTASNKRFSFIGKNDKISLLKNNRTIEQNSETNSNRKYAHLFNRIKNKNNKNSYKLLEKEEKKIENISLDNKKKKENQKITISSKDDKNKEKELKFIKDIKDIKIIEDKNKSIKDISSNYASLSPSSQKNVIQKNNGIEDSNSINTDNQSTFININSNSNSNTMIISESNNSFSLVNPFCLNGNNNGSNNKNLIVDDIRLDNNNKVIKEMASELEQSTAKKDIVSNKEGDKFEITKGTIEPVNLVKTIQEEKDIPTPSTFREKVDILFSNSMNENTLDSNIKTERINNNLDSNSLINQKERQNSTEKNKSNNNNKYNAINKNEQKLIDKKVLLTNKKLMALEKYTKEKIIEIFAQINKLKLIYNHLDKINDINSSLKEKNSSLNSFKGILSTNNNTDKTNIVKSLSIKNDDKIYKNNIINFKKNKNGFDLTCSNFYRNKLYKIEPSNQKIFNYSCKKLKTCSNLNEIENPFNSAKSKDFFKRNIFSQKENNNCENKKENSNNKENKKWDINNINIINKIKNNEFKKVKYRNNSLGNIYLTQKGGETISFNETDIKLVYLNKLVNEYLPYAPNDEESFNL